jgi:hypothetical protein
MNSLLRLRSCGLALGLFGALVLRPAVAHATDDVAAPVAPPDAPIPFPLWDDIKSDTYDQRAHFAEGAKHMLARLDEEIGKLNAKRAGMTTDTKDWDFDMKEVNNCRTLLQSRITDLGQANTPETWADAKDKVGEAWRRALLALDKMKSARTS